MRMRHKKNLGQRMSACGGRLIYLEPAVLDDRVDDPSAVPLDIGKIFGGADSAAPSGAVSLEADIGCGKGGFVCGCARLSPGTRLLAVESLGNVIVAGCETAAAEGLDNIRFVCVGAQYLTRYIPPHSLDRIYLNFSCPYPKSGHESKRLTSPRFLERYRLLLKPGGEIWQKTDNAEFFEYSLESFAAAGLGLRNVTHDLHSEPAGKYDDRAYIVTEYERRFIGQGKPICRAEAYLKES